MLKGLIVSLGELEQVPLGQGHCFVVKGEEIAIFRQRDGAIFAIQNKCPHRQGPLSEGVVGGGKVVCPLHGHKFDLATGEGSEQCENVKTFKVWQEHGQIMLEFLPESPETEDAVMAKYAELVLTTNTRLFYKQRGEGHVE